MKKGVYLINQLILGVASIRSGFMFALLGVIAQTFHTFNITIEFSSFEGFLMYTEAIITSAFLSGGLLYNTINQGKAESGADMEKYKIKTNLFAILEVGINMYYWLNKLLFNQWGDWEQIRWDKIALAMGFSIIVPLIIKSYAGELKLSSIEADVKTSRVPELDQLVHVQASVESLQHLITQLTTEKVSFQVIDYDSETLRYNVRFTLNPDETPPEV